jgi:CHAD domain-containing protein
MTATAASPIAKPATKPSSRPKVARAKPKLGLRVWMERVLVECDRAAAGFEADPVHDLRVALRRCRSLADGLIALDPDSSWKDMKKTGRKLFQGLGELRDMQVMEEWIEKLGDVSGRVVRDSVVDDPASGNRSSADHSSADHSSGDHSSGDHLSGDPVAVKLLTHIHAHEAECKQRAFKDLNQFDRKQWRQWARSLPQRASRVRPGSVVHLHLALEKWTAAYELHKHALRTRSQVSLHELRIGIKRFRYTVENFLPRQHESWGSDLKELQDLLGDVHDLDVLWATAVEITAFPDAESQRRWRERLNLERGKRIERYRAKMVGKESLWRVWRAELPSGPSLRAAAMSRLRTWAGYLDPDFSHSQRVAQLTLLLYDGLKSASLLTAVAAASGPAEADRGAISRARTNHARLNHARSNRALSNPEDDWRAVLQAAALLHDVGKAHGAENHQKSSYRMIRGLARPLGWSARELELVAVVARYHRGALPRPRAKTLQMLELPDRPIAMELAGVLRLANALDFRHARDGHEEGDSPRLEVSLQETAVVVRTVGYSALDRSAEAVAAARHLLETVLRRPVLVHGLRAAAGDSRPAAPVANH